MGKQSRAEQRRALGGNGERFWVERAGRTRTQSRRWLSHESGEGRGGKRKEKQTNRKAAKAEAEAKVAFCRVRRLREARQRLWEGEGTREENESCAGDTARHIYFGFY